MSFLKKVIKPLAIVAAIGLVALPGGQVFTAGILSSLGVAGGTAAFGLAATINAAVIGLGASSALGIGAKALDLGPKAPKSVLGQLDRLNASLVPGTARKIALGSTALSTDIRYIEPSGAEQEYIDYIIAVASHRVTSIDELWFEDKLAWSASAGVAGTYAGYLTVDIRTEGTAANAIPINGGAVWGSNHRLTGCAYVHLRVKRSGATKAAASPLVQGLPGRVTIIGKGAPMYDPRRDSTAGGSGSMRANDQSTWAYSDGGTDLGENTALQILWYQLGWRINGKLAVGRGLPAKYLDMASFIEAANLCDEQVNRSVGGTEARYASACAISESDDPQAALGVLTAACNGQLRDGGGKLGLVIKHNDLALAAADPGLTDHNVLSGFTWDQDQPLSDGFNIVRGRWIDPSSTSLYQPVPYPDVVLPSPDGIDRVLTLDLLATESASRAQRIAKQALQRRQYQRTFAATFDAEAWRYRIGSIVPLTFAALSFDRKLFRVVDQTPTMDGTCPMVLREESAQVYAWDNDDAAPVLPATPIKFDPLLNPLIRGIEEAGTTAEWPGISDPDGTMPEDNATDGAVLDPAAAHGALRHADGSIVYPAEVLNSAVNLGSDGRLTALINGVSVDLGRVKLPDLGAASEASRQQIDRDLARISEAVARLAVGQQRVMTVFRDAGLYTDPASGVAKLFAVERTAERTTDLQVSLNAALASINLKASVEYVNNQIAMAVIDPSQVAELETILVRLTSAEVDIDGLAATVALKADATTITAISGTVSSVQASLDALAATVALKANTTIVNALETRTAAAELTLSTLDTPTITQSIAIGRNAAGDRDRAAGSATIAMMLADKARREAVQDVALARSDLKADIISATDAFASARLELGVKIGEVSALVAQETVARITADSASSTTLTAFQVTVAGSFADVTTSIGAVSTAQSATAAELASYKASTNGNLATITSSLSAVTTESAATTAALASFQSTTAGNLASISTALATQTDNLGAVAGSLATLSTTVGGHTATLTEHASSIDGLELRWGVEFDIDGRVTGFVLNGSGARTDAIFKVDSLKVVKAGASPRTVFAIGDDGNTYILGKLTADSIETAMLKADAVTFGEVAIDSFGSRAFDSTTATYSRTSPGTTAVGDIDVYLPNVRTGSSLGTITLTVDGFAELSGGGTPAFDARLYFVVTDPGGGTHVMNVPVPNEITTTYLLGLKESVLPVTWSTDGNVRIQAYLERGSAASSVNISVSSLAVTARWRAFG